MIVKINIYDKVKYDKASKKIAECEHNIKGFKVVCGGLEAKEIESYTDDSGVDEFHEYLILELNNGETSTFRNSYVDMFKIF